MLLATALLVLLAPCMQDDGHANRCGGVVESLSGCVFPPSARPSCLGHSHAEDGVETRCHGHSHNHETTHHHPRVSALPGVQKTDKSCFQSAPAVPAALAQVLPPSLCGIRPSGACAVARLSAAPLVSLPLLA